MLSVYVEHWRGVYADLKCKPCLVVGANELVGIYMEMVIVTSEEYVGEYPDPHPGVPGHTFLTRLIDDEWFIAANSRRLPRPGWPPTEEEIPGLFPDA